MQWIYETIRWEEWDVLLAALSFIVFIAGLIMIFSLRQTLCFLFACLATLILSDILLVIVKNWPGGGRDAIATAVVFFIFGGVLLPLGFIAAWVAAAMKIWKKELCLIKKPARRLGGAVLAAAGLAVVLWPPFD